jgi:hypothetical protein
MFGRFILQLGANGRHSSLAIVKYLNHRPYRADCVVIVRQDDVSSVSSDGRNRFPVVPLASERKRLLLHAEQWGPLPMNLLSPTAKPAAQMV